jgi:hypothetical protein
MDRLRPKRFQTTTDEKGILAARGFVNRRTASETTIASVSIAEKSAIPSLTTLRTMAAANKATA